MPKAYLVNAATREITVIEGGWRNMVRYLPGGLTTGATWPNGDTMFVDDEGLLHPATKAFRIKDRPDGQPMMSNGVLEGMDGEGESRDPKFTIEELAAKIEWLTVEEALNWFRARSSSPAATIQSGNNPPEVIAQFSTFLAILEGKE